MTPPAVVAIYQNEGPYLAEWLAWHRAFGVGRFLLYDNDSTDGGAVAAPDVLTIKWPGRAVQLPAYRDALRRLAGEVPWVAFLDLDEFLWSPDGGDLSTVLAAFPGADAVWAPWRLFGWGPFLTRPSCGVVQAYRWRAAETDASAALGKTIVRPEAVRGIVSPHHFLVRRGTTDASPLLVNHYFTRSREEALVKCARPRADTGVFRDWTTEFEAQADRFAAIADHRLALIQARVLLERTLR